MALTAGVVLGVAAGGVGWWLLGPVDGGEERVVVIARGASAWAIGRQLAEAGLVRTPASLVVAAALQRRLSALQEGEYVLRPSQSALEIADRLARGATRLHRVTIPEGYTVRQIADVLAGAGLVDRARFLDVALRRGRTLGRPWLAALPTESLEGYLFPDTYYLPRGLSEEAVVGHLVDRFEAAVDASVRAAAAARGLSLHELITVASMVEREAQVPEERPVIAAVIYNRLARGMRLEIDATVLYALGQHKAVVTLTDLAVESPYNTYRRQGLPPGPIASPGLAALEAAAHPAAVPYLYYVRRPDGRHHFSRTLAEHLDAVRRYRP
ncbi:MAG: endolytic transglycosylase MltG [Armatimonadota bacterium]|nr:endolytic transglycosylase MltG [Armatimonadota bacterium]MDR7534642.1 endolytic transglycosylase MltG [Armatimonadota bacterium]MDR7537056.1 endolytic transglycosylase MltG [Armatimonadota bacterium]